MTSPDVVATPPRMPAVAVDSEAAVQRQLVRRAQRGDVAAFEELYRANVGRVYGLCLRMAGDASQAEELAQEAFIRAWSKLQTFRGDSAFSTWMHRLTVNTVLGQLRSRLRREGRQAELEGGELPDRAARRTPDAAVDLERAIAGLPDGARTVFVLHDVEGYRHREISKLTGMAVGTSKAQLHRARKLLRKALGR